MASVNYSTSSATIEAEEGMELDEDELLAAVANTNHAIDSMQYAAAIANRSDFNSERVLAVEGMMCAESCAPTVQAALEAVVGTAHVEVCGILADKLRIYQRINCFRFRMRTSLLGSLVRRQLLH